MTLLPLIARSGVRRLCRRLTILSLTAFSLGATLAPRDTAAQVPLLPTTDNEQQPFMGFYCNNLGGGQGLERSEVARTFLYRQSYWLMDFQPFANFAEISGNQGYINGAKWKKTHPDAKFQFVMGLAPLPGFNSNGIGFLASGVTWTKAANHEYDDFFRTLADGMIRQGMGDTIIRIGYEFNGVFMPWKITHTNDQRDGAGNLFDDRPANFVAHWRNIVTAMRFKEDGSPREGANFKFCWNGSLNFNASGATTKTIIQQCYPGDDVVDFVGVDFYDSSFAKAPVFPKIVYPYTTFVFPYGTDAEQRQNNAFEDNTLSRDYGVLSVWRAIARAHGKPLAFPEWGCLDRISGNGAGHGGIDNPNFIRKMHELIHNPENNVAWHIYFDHNSAGNLDSRITTQPRNPGETRFLNAQKEYRRLFGVKPFKTEADIGTVTTPGSSNVTEVLGTGSGCAANGTSDSLHFAYRPAQNTDVFVVKLTKMTAGPGMQSGIMLRGSISANAPYAGLLLANGQCHFQVRKTAGGPAYVYDLATGIAAPTETAPVWLRLIRRTSEILAYRSSDGLNWTLAGAQDVTLPAGSLFGVAVSGSGGVNTTGIDNVDMNNIWTRDADSSPIAGAVIRDNTDIGVTKFGAWNLATNLGDGYYGVNYSDAGGITAPASTFEFLAPLNPGLHAVYARWPGGHRLHFDVPVDVTSADGTDLLSANMTTGAYQWNYLGTYKFGTSGRVKIKREIVPSEPNNFTLADSVMFVPMTTPLTFEAEAVAGITGSTGDAVSTFTEPEASAGVGSKILSNEVGDFINYPLPGIPAGSYSVRVRFKKFDSRGRFQLSIDGVNQGAPQDQYAAAGSYAEVDLGVKNLTAGTHNFRFTVEGKNAVSKGRDLTVDYIRLVPATRATSIRYEPEFVLNSKIGTNITSSPASSRFVDPAASAQQALKGNATGSNQYLEFPMPNVAAGTYRIKMRYKNGTTRAITQVTFDGVNQGASIDQFSTAGTIVEIDLGTKTFSAGSHICRITATGKNAASTGFDFTIDALDLTLDNTTPTLSFEVESLTPVEASKTVSPFSETAASGGVGVRLPATVTGDFVRYSLPVATAGVYSIKVRFKRNNTRGKFQLAVNGVDIGGPVDQYASTASYVEVDIGAEELSAGNHDFRFTVTGANAASTGLDITLDSIRLVP